MGRIWKITVALVAATGLMGCSTNSNSNSSSTIEKTNDNTSQAEILSYQTTYNGKKITKKALVYLPKNYDKNEKHNVLYLLHGSTEVKNGLSQLYQEGNFKNVFDSWNSNTIVVFPTYYQTAKQVTSNYYSDNPLNKSFAKTELVDDLMPAVAKNYQTYAKDDSKESLRKARDHQAFGGFSMGAITTWYVFQYDLPYFKYFIPMAGDSWTVESDGGASAPKETAQVLADAVKKNNDLSFKILAGVGSGDSTRGSMQPQIEAMGKLPEFKNKIQYYVQPDGGHDPQTMAKIIRHYSRSIFH